MKKNRRYGFAFAAAFTIMIFLIILFLVKSFWFFPVLICGGPVTIIIFLNLALKKGEPVFSILKLENDFQIKNAQFAIERKKFIIQYIVIPLFLGFVAYLVTDRIYGEKKMIVIGIYNSSYSDTVDLAKIYKERYINRANEMLGAFNPGLQFDIVTISGGYEQIWEALNNNRIDIAFVNSYNFYHKLTTMSNSVIDLVSNHSRFDSIYTLIGGKYTELGDHYYSGFLTKKRSGLKDTAALIHELKKNSHYKIDFVSDSLSGSGRVIPSFYLRNKGFGKYLDNADNLGTLAHIVSDVINDTSGNTICTFSSDMWNNMKKLTPKQADSLNFVEIDDIKLPLDAVVVKKENWDSTNSKWNNFVDFVKLRNTDIRKSRKDIIITSLRYMMDKNTSTLRSTYLELAKYKLN